MAKKISELDFLSSFNGNEDVLLAKENSNKRTDLDTLKAFFGDSGCAVFSEIITAEVNEIHGAPTPEEGAVIDIVYITTKQRFMARKTITSATYYDAFASMQEFMTDGVPRRDRAFLCIADKTIYLWDGADLYDPYKPIVLTQEEYDALVKKDENKTYYIYEEE